MQTIGKYQYGDRCLALQDGPESQPITSQVKITVQVVGVSGSDL